MGRLRLHIAGIGTEADLFGHHQQIVECLACEPRVPPVDRDLRAECLEMFHHRLRADRIVSSLLHEDNGRQRSRLVVADATGATDGPPLRLIAPLRRGAKQGAVAIQHR